MAEALEIARFWSFWDGVLPESQPRRVALPAQLDPRLALVVQGVRRCGKSTLLQQLVRHYALPPAHCAFLNCEDPRLGFQATWELLEALVQAFRAQHPKAKALYFFLDEIQQVQGWERWLHTQLERPQGHHFVLTGSNAQLLSGELASALTGRHLSLELFPFSLEESQQPLKSYLRLGGFPAPLALPEREGDRLRLQYFVDIIERDLRERVGARSGRAVKQVLQMAFESAGSELSLRRLAGATGMAVETVATYLEAAEAAYLLFGCPHFAYSERKRASRNKKYYPVDPGLHRCVTTQTGRDLGKRLELATFVALRAQGLTPSYWRGRGEVDFVVQTSAGLRPIQVTWEAPQARHEAALETFYAEFPQAGEALHVTAETFGQLPGQLGFR